MTLDVNWSLFVSTFLLIFVAELPDKTALSILLMATRKHPIALFLGVALAFLVQTIVAMMFGRLLGALPEFWIHVGTGILFLITAVFTWRAKPEAEANEPTSSGRLDRNAFLHAFTVIFIAEWGDLTQLATASLAAQHPENSWTIFFAAVLGLWSVTALVIFAGTQLKRRVNQVAMQKIGAIMFFGLGLYFLFSAF